VTRLAPSLFTRIDESPDELFYAEPRFVTHLDDAAIAAVTQLYREYFPAGGAVLDLMSSWISHLPPEVTYRRVIGLGMNREELGANPRLHGFAVQNLNETPRLPWDAGEFDGAAICVSVDYLTRPVEVLRECGRVLRTGGPLVITFSNRCFPSKIIAAWRALDDHGHQELVARYFAEAGNWTAVEMLDRSPGRIAGPRGGDAAGFDPGDAGGDPLYAVIARSVTRA